MLRADQVLELSKPPRDAARLLPVPVAPGDGLGREVALGELTPGMMLAQPLLSMDGQVVLDARVVLDEKLVKRIWQLCAVRALKTSVAIVQSSVS